jgi:hypothetical protein
MAKSTKKAAPKKKSAVKSKAAVKKAAPKKKGLYGFSLKQRKSVPIKNAVIEKKKNHFIATGDDGKGSTIRAFLGGEAAKVAVSKGQATKKGRW